MDYQIQKKYIKNNRSNERLVPKGMVCHSTADPGATDENEQSYYNNTAKLFASAHTFIDWDSITETVPCDPNNCEVAWASGRTSNHMFLQVELCEPKGHDPAKFAEVWKRAVWYFAYKFVNVIKVTKITKDNLMSHAEVSAKWKETDHQDPVEYFRGYGRTIDQFRIEVQAKINEILGKPAPSPSQPPVEKYGVVTSSSLNVRSGAGTNFKIIGTLKQGDKVKLQALSNSWWKIYFGDHDGFVSAQYIKV